jgi:hypothetical protein
MKPIELMAGTIITSTLHAIHNTPSQYSYKVQVLMVGRRSMLYNIIDRIARYTQVVQNGGKSVVKWREGLRPSTTSVVSIEERGTPRDTRVLMMDRELCFEDCRSVIPS